MNTPPEPPRDFLQRVLCAAFVFAVAAFAWWRFSDNTADNDLWGHVLYGQRMIALGRAETVDPFSWTAAGVPWTNHEIAAELALGAVHRSGGATGLWLLTIAMALIVLVLAWREAHRGQAEAGLKFTTLALFAASTNSLALGFSARPQLFTLLGLVLLLGLLRRAFAGSRAAMLMIPPLLWAWMYTHGGVLVGLLITAVAAIVTGAQGIMSGQRMRRPFVAVPPGAGWRLLIAFLLAVGGLFSMPEGREMLRWLIGSVAYLRPEITEWRATPLDTEHLTFFFVALVSVIAWCASRRKRSAWEAAVLGLLLIMALRHQRHLPLFCLANLISTPPHLLDLLQRVRPHAANLIAAFQQKGFRAVATIALLAGGTIALAKSFAAPRVSPWRIEVERDDFPCAALEFLRAHPLEGRLLVFFDWGQQAMWELPHNRISFDGRLDTIYSRAVIEAHWKFYRGEESPAASPDLLSADIALLPARSGGVRLLQARGWSLVYADPLAEVLVREPRRHPSLATLALPVARGLEAVQGREPFPEKPSTLAHPAAIRRD
ncbi:MAG TPA: hypothetical protein VHO24_01845 [Opitutaceae bacterium]|nr:hypothetical protein [Opitutaceae bacterium]